METTGDRIKKKRNDLGLTLVEVAEKVGVRDATIQRYESGEIKNIKQPILIKIAKVLNVSVGYLLGYETEDAHKIAEAMKNHDAREVEKLMGFPEGTIGSFIKKGSSKPNCNNLNDKTNIPQLMELVNHFNQLNKKGQIKAIENVSDLTKIQEYRKENLLESKTIDFEKEKKKKRTAVLHHRGFCRKWKFFSYK